MSKAPENLIETLKESLRQTRFAENNRKEKLTEVKAKNNNLEEIGRIEQEISALQAFAKQTEAAIESLLKGLPYGIDIREQ